MQNLKSGAVKESSQTATMRSVMLLLAGAFAGCAADLAQIKAAADKDIVAQPAARTPLLKAATTPTPPPTMLKGFEECTIEQMKLFAFCTGKSKPVPSTVCDFYVNEAFAWECYLQVPCVNAKVRMSGVDVDICTSPTYNQRLQDAQASCAVGAFFSPIATVRDRDCARTRKPTSSPTPEKPTSAPTSPTSRESAIKAPSAAGKFSAAFVLLAIALLGLER